MEKLLIPKEFEILREDGWREAAIYGGRFSTKSHSVARTLLIEARKKKLRIACFREFQNSIGDSSHQLLHDLINKYNLTDFIVTNNSITNSITGSEFIFKGLHRNEQGVKSVEAIDIAWVEEAQTVTEASLEILVPTIRKKGSKIIYTYNRLRELDPVHKRLVVEGRPGAIVINVNYDVAEKNGFLPDIIKQEIDDDKEKRPNLYKHKWLGEPNTNSDARVFTNWTPIDEVPQEAVLIYRGLDFGYKNDPTAAVEIYKWNDAFVFNEILYKKKMFNKDIADRLPDCNVVTICDSASPKDIAELSSVYGVSTVGATKGKGSILDGVNWLQEQKIFFTKSSKNLANEYANYLWVWDKNLNIWTNTPEDNFNHCMDAIRYGCDKLIYREKDIEDVWEGVSESDLFED